MSSAVTHNGVKGCDSFPVFWSRQRHAGFGVHVNNAFSAFLLGFQRLVCAENSGVPDADPEMVEQTLESFHRYDFESMLQQLPNQTQSKVLNAWMFASNEHSGKLPISCTACQDKACSYTQWEFLHYRLNWKPTTGTRFTAGALLFAEAATIADAVLEASANSSPNALPTVSKKFAPSLEKILVQVKLSHRKEKLQIATIGRTDLQHTNKRLKPLPVVIEVLSSDDERQSIEACIDAWEGIPFSPDYIL